MKEILIKIWFMTLAIMVILLEAIALLLLAPFILFIHCWEMVRYQAQCLRHPPPPEGIYGAMGRYLREQRQGKISKEENPEN